MKILSLCMEGESIPWSDYYSTQCGLKSLPLLPTYKFDNMRIWPEVGNLLSANLLQLQHKHKYLGEGQKQDLSAVSTVDSGVMLASLAETINEMLVVNHDWNVVGDESLFKYGMDSLIFSQVCIKFNCVIPFSEFHKDPNLNSLLQSLACNTKFTSATPTSIKS